MKKIHFSLFFATALLTLLLSACKDDPVLYNPEAADGALGAYVDGLDGVSVLSDEVRSVEDVMAAVLNNGMFDLTQSPMISQISGMVASQLADTVAAWNERYGISASQAKVRCVKYLFRTVDQNGDPVVLSSYATWPYPDIDCPQEKVILDRVILFCPYSQTKESFCATATYGGAANILIAKDALIVSPDPQGFGYNAGNYQMYMNHELIGRQSADALAAAYKVFRSLGFKLNKNFYLTPMGMSQGASTAVATHKYLENTEVTVGSQSYALADLWQLRYSLAACGPYSPELTMSEYLAWQTFAHPGVVPLVLKTMAMSYPETFGSYTEEDMYAANYLTHKDFFDSIYRFKPYSIDEINALMFEMVSTPEHQVSNPETMVLTDLLSSAMLDNNSELNAKMRQCLQRNDLTTGWVPQHPIYITASDNDDYVPYTNATALQSMAPNKVHLLETDHYSHVMSCCFWLLKVLNDSFAL